MPEKGILETEAVRANKAVEDDIKKLIGETAQACGNSLQLDG